MSIGMLGEYIGKIYEQSKERPLYLVARTLNVESAKHEPASEPLSRSRVSMTDRRDRERS